jgi:hypothetical protein
MLEENSKCNVLQNIPHHQAHEASDINMNDHSDLHEHCEALFPYSTQRGVAKFVDSAQLNP